MKFVMLAMATTLGLAGPGAPQDDGNSLEALRAELRQRAQQILVTAHDCALKGNHKKAHEYTTIAGHLLSALAQKEETRGPIAAMSGFLGSAGPSKASSPSTASGLSTSPGPSTFSGLAITDDAFGSGLAVVNNALGSGLAVVEDAFGSGVAVVDDGFQGDGNDPNGSAANPFDSRSAAFLNSNRRALLNEEPLQVENTNTQVLQLLKELRADVKALRQEVRSLRSQTQSRLPTDQRADPARLPDGFHRPSNFAPSAPKDPVLPLKELTLPRETDPEAAPTIEGQVIATDPFGDSVMIAVTEPNRVRKGEVFHIYRGSTYVGQAIVDSISKGTCMARADLLASGKSIKERDRATTRL